MKKLGVGIGIINSNRSPRLVNALGAGRVPTIIGVINGRVMFYNDRVTVQGLKDFVMGLFPRGLIEKVRINVILLEFFFLKKVTCDLSWGILFIYSFQWPKLLGKFIPFFRFSQWHVLTITLFIHSYYYCAVNRGKIKRELCIQSWVKQSSFEPLPWSLFLNKFLSEMFT